MIKTNRMAFGSGSSVAVRYCQVCGHEKFETIFFLGYLPLVNQKQGIGKVLIEQPGYPAQLLFCNKCSLVQLGIIIDPLLLYPPDYPYLSSVTRTLRDNFIDLYNECQTIVTLSPDDLIIDIGSNDGNLLSNFKGKYRVLGITPENSGKIAIENGIPTIIDFLTKEVVSRINSQDGKAKIITATNVFAHMENINEVLDRMLEIMMDEGVLVIEVLYLVPFLEDLQYDRIYLEHLCYYSLHSLNYLLKLHGLEIIHAKQIPTHGGSIRVYAARKGKHKIRESVFSLMNKGKKLVLSKESFLIFKKRASIAKLEFLAMVSEIKKQGKRIYGVGASSRAVSLVNYVGIDENIIDYVLEIKGSNKIGNYMPGTLIPVENESKLFEDQPEYALLLSWHIADELAHKLRQKGFKGDFIVPLPHPKVIKIK